ncbi:Repeat domain-containing protein [Poseidonocella pacifica]|uniref:Repeat domain-containing protein n=1 Tax=Poseidonocella pacifica TaxID=871651 RepID=A0A1I0WK21_9RHOB|nr:CRTAC1 family protein [Poseidonocella pacifica]SFA89092.1 Repeat domain-containing protein [Poseidonocella pacifica]
MRYASIVLLGGLLAGAAQADPRFDLMEALPSPHVYDGGWEHFVGGGVATFDCNGDDLPEVFMAGGTNPAALYLNRGGFRFERGDFEPETGVTGAYPLDIDGDGHLDLAVLRVGENHLYRGLGGCQFALANDEWGFDGGTAWSTAFSATWEQGAEWPTLAVGNYVDREDPDGPFGTCDDNALYRPEGRRFGPPHVLTPGFCALSMLFSDRGRDGPADLRISNDRHYYLRDGHEQLLSLSDLDWLSEDDGWQRISIWGMGIASRDITGDARPEVMLTSMGDQLLQIARPDGGYDQAPYDIGTYAQRPFLGDDGRPSTGWHAEFGDIDNDGRDDLFIAKGNVDQMPSNASYDPNNLLMQTADSQFEEAGNSAGVASTARSRGAALADLDLDGRLDLIVVNRRAPAEMYRNLSEAGNWIAVRPRQAGPNRDAVGARVEVRLPGKNMVQEITVGGGHVSGSLLPRHFGLGNAAKVEVRVRWPDGTHSAWQNVDANTRIDLVR